MADGNPPRDGYDSDDEDDNAIDEGGYKAVKDAVLFAIDISKSMLQKPVIHDTRKPDAALSPALAALKCAYALMQQRIISNPSDMMGILLFGTKESSCFDDKHGGNPPYAHCYLLTDLDVPAAADVKRLRSLVEDEENRDILQASDEEVKMSNVLFCANEIFVSKASNFASRRLFLVTDNDDPHSASAKSTDDRKAAAVRAKDLYDLGVTIDLFPISHPDRGYTFDRSKFYNDIVYSATPSDPDAPAPWTTDVKLEAQDGIALLEALRSSINSRAAPRRAIFSNLPFEIGPGFKISVKGFIILKRQEPKRTSYIYLPPDDNKPQIAIGSTTLIADDTARCVEKVEVRKAYKFGGETISFTPEELSKIKNFGEPVLRIIGFKPMSLLPMWASVKPATFIYPSEEEYTGSTRVFSALHQKLLKDQKMGVAWYIARKNAIPTIVAIIPGKTRHGTEGEQVIPAGLWIKPLPYADDIRQPPDTNIVRAPQDLVMIMRDIVAQMKLPGSVYDPRKYPNPALQWFYKILQALALDEDIPETREDKTMPRAKAIHQRTGELVLQWGEYLDEAHRQWQAENSSRIVTTGNGATKRTQPLQSSTAKKVKEESTDAPSEEEIRKAYDKQILAKMTVKDLKGFLLSKKLGRGIAKKADLVDAITKYFETKMNL